jgi:hypothetical protein
MSKSPPCAGFFVSVVIAPASMTGRDPTTENDPGTR